MRELMYKDEAYKAIDNCIRDGWYRISPVDAKMNIHHLISDANRLQDDTVGRQYLLAEIDDLADEFSEVDENGLHSERWCGIMDAKQIIINTPFVSDRPQGEWIIEIDANGYTYGRCSICGMKQYAGQLNFCPNCGANMKGDPNEI